MIESIKPFESHIIKNVDINKVDDIMLSIIQLVKKDFMNELQVAGTYNGTKNLNIKSQFGFIYKTQLIAIKYENASLIIHSRNNYLMIFIYFSLSICGLVAVSVSLLSINILAILFSSFWVTMVFLITNYLQKIQRIKYSEEILRVINKCLITA